MVFITFMQWLHRIPTNGWNSEAIFLLLEISGISHFLLLQARQYVVNVNVILA